MTATQTIRFARRGHEWGVIVNGTRIGYVYRSGSVWRVRHIDSCPAAGSFPTRQAAGEALTS